MGISLPARQYLSPFSVYDLISPFRDRIGPFWQNLRDHFYNLIVNATENTFLVERAVVGLLRLSIRLLRREEIAPQVRYSNVSRHNNQ